MSSPHLDTDIIYTDSAYEICDCGIVIIPDLLRCECKCEDLSFVTDSEQQSSYSESEEESSYSCSQSDHSESDESETQSYSTY